MTYDRGFLCNGTGTLGKRDSMNWKQYAWDCLFALGAWTFFICGAVGILALGMYLSVQK